jgi:hypothetical protein
MAASLLWLAIRSRIAPWRDRDAAALRAVLDRLESQSSNLAMVLRTSSILRMRDDGLKAHR